MNRIFCLLIGHKWLLGQNQFGYNYWMCERCEKHLKAG